MSQPTYRRRRPAADCPGCGLPRYVRQDGAIRNHSAPGSGLCPGSGTQPAVLPNGR
jgi:hypothetical protein